MKRLIRRVGDYSINLEAYVREGIREHYTIRSNDGTLISKHANLDNAYDWAFIYNNPEPTYFNQPYKRGV